MTSLPIDTPPRMTVIGAMCSRQLDISMHRCTHIVITDHHVQTNTHIHTYTRPAQAT